MLLPVPYFVFLENAFASLIGAVNFIPVWFCMAHVIKKINNNNFNEGIIKQRGLIIKANSKHIITKFGLKLFVNVYYRYISQMHTYFYQ